MGLLSSFWLLRAIERAATAALLDAGSVELAADDGVTDTDVLHATTADEDNRVLLEVVTLSRDVGSDFHTIRKAHTSNLTNSRVWLAGGLGRNARTDTALERRIEIGRAVFERVKATTEGSGLGFIDTAATTLPYELIDG